LAARGEVRRLLRLERDGDRVRLITRGGYNWADRYPWIVETALKNRHQQFVIDGEAVLLKPRASGLSAGAGSVLAAPIRAQDARGGTLADRKAPSRSMTQS
jgi:hypothetical protein